MARIIWQRSLNGDCLDISLLMKNLEAFKKENRRDTEPTLKALLHRIALYKHMRKIKLISAEKLSEQQKNTLISALTKDKTGATEPQFDTDKSLISGIRIEDGYSVTDYSIARQIEMLKNEFLKD